MRVAVTLALLATALVAMHGRAQTAQAVRVQVAPRIDGRLNESVWATAPMIGNFAQKEPNEGQPSPDQTEVRFVYDEDALYVGARMYAAKPADIRTIVTRRDEIDISEFIGVSLDTYRDRRTAYSFAVTPAGVRGDFFHSNDDDDGDDGFNPVWEASAIVDSLGWTAEMRIPFNQLRFSPRDVQEWGLNVVRKIPSRNEEDFWRLIRRDENGWASRMGALTGIRGIRPSRRVEALPYVAANSRLAAVSNPANPFEHRTQSTARVGGDLKAGLGPNLTLDVTLNPDFGQVEADPAVVNLSAYEVFFDERRPFFTEGASLLDRRHLFYSRRIGAQPPGNAGADFAEERANSTILGAAKLSGRLPSKLSVAALGAVTDREVVRTYDATSALFDHAEVAPRTAYAAASAQQEFGRDASTIGGMVTFVQRDVDAGTPLADLLARTALSGILDGRFRWARGMYDVNFWTAYTNVRGDSASILRQQRSSRRYWQRPDADYVNVDPTRRSLSGAYVGIGHSKVSGRHWLWDVDYFFLTPGFEPNDMGASGAVDNRYALARLQWRENQPSRAYRAYRVGIEEQREWSWDWLQRERGPRFFWDVTLPNYWELYGDAYRNAPAFSDRLTRGGPVMGTPAQTGIQIEMQSREGARHRFDVDYRAERDDNGGFSNSLELGFGLRPNDRLSISFDPEWRRERDARQYIATFPNGRAATFGSRYVFAAVDLHEVSGRLRVNYTFTPNLTLETYAQPFAASGWFHGFGELSAPRSRDLVVYGTSGTTITRNADGSHTVTDGGGASTFDIEPQDFNERSFRSNVVLRWEWRLGSTLYLVWQQDRSADRAYAPARPRDLFDALDTRGTSFFAVKVSYWVPID